MSGKDVLYFGYASCMLADRMRNSVSNPTRFGIGRLEDHKLVFHKYNDNWKGHFAHAAPCKGEHVWGAIWRITEEDMNRIYQQESVDKGVYEARAADVATPDGTTVSVVYITDASDEAAQETTGPTAPRPSPQYKAVIVSGAIESGIPQDYIDRLKAVPDNAYGGEFDFKNIKINF